MRSLIIRRCVGCLLRYTGFILGANFDVFASRDALSLAKKLCFVHHRLSPQRSNLTGFPLVRRLSCLHLTYKNRCCIYELIDIQYLRCSSEVKSAVAMIFKHSPESATAVMSLTARCSRHLDFDAYILMLKRRAIRFWEQSANQQLLNKICRPQR